MGRPWLRDGLKGAQQVCGQGRCTLMTAKSVACLNFGLREESGLDLCWSDPVVALLLNSEKALALESECYGLRAETLSRGALELVHLEVPREAVVVVAVAEVAWVKGMVRSQHS